MTALTGSPVSHNYNRVAAGRGRISKIPLGGFESHLLCHLEKHIVSELERNLPLRRRLMMRLIKRGIE